MVFLQKDAVEAMNIGFTDSIILGIPYLFMIMLVIFGSLYNGVGDNFTAMGSQ